MNYHFLLCFATTPNSNRAWVIQQVWQLVCHPSDAPLPMRFFIHDCDSKFSASFDHVFASEGIKIVCTLIRAPKANAVAQR